MKKILLSALSILAFSGMAEACPVKKGYVASGMTRTPAGLTPECGVLWQAFRRPLVGDPNIKWAELYTLSSSSAGKVGASLEKTLKAKGFALLKSTEISNGHQFGYARLSTGKIVMVQIMVLQGEMLLGILGN